MEDKKTKHRFDEYVSMITWKRTPISESWKDNLAKELYDWAKDDPEAFKVSQFYAERGISTEDFFRWMETHQRLKMAHSAALILIGNRREIGSIKRKYDSATILRSMPKYDKQWKDIAEWFAALKALADKNAQTRGPLTVLMDNFNEEQEVKKKPVKKIKSKKS